MPTRPEPSRILRDAEVKFLPVTRDRRQFVEVQGGLCEIVGVEFFGDLYQYVLWPMNPPQVRLYLSRLDKNAWVLRLVPETVTDEILDAEERMERRM